MAGGFTRDAVPAVCECRYAIDLVRHCCFGNEHVGRVAVASFAGRAESWQPSTWHGDGAADRDRG